MSTRRLVFSRILPAAFILAAYALPGARAQEARPSEESGTIRVYVVDRRIGSMAGLQDAAASLTLRYRTGRGETVLLGRAVAERALGEGAEGAIRGLIGSGEFVELFWGDGRVSSGPGPPRPRARPGGRCRRRAKS